MKKTFYLSLILFFLSIVIFPKLSFASITFSATELGRTSVVLKSEGLLPLKEVTFTVRTHISNQGTIPYYLEEHEAISNSTGIATSKFIGLTPGGMYVGTANYTGENPTLGIITFTTLTSSQTVLSITNPGQTTITLKAESLSPNANMFFNLKNKDSITPTYLESQQAISDNTGIAFSDFSGMSSGGHYEGSVSYYGNNETLGTVTFYTFSAPPPPPPPPPPSPALSPGGLVPCGTEYKEIGVNGKKEMVIANPCEADGFGYLMKMINKVINFILFTMAVPIAAIMFAYAGFLLVFSGGEPAKRTKAKSIFINVAIGLVLAVAAWLIINTILSILGFQGGWIGFTG